MEITLNTRKRSYTWNLGSKAQSQSDLSVLPSARSQIRENTSQEAWTSFNAELPFRFNLGWIDTIRASLPFMDIVPSKYYALIGEIERFETYGNKALEDFLWDFYQNIKVNHFGKGFGLFQYQCIDSAIAKGMSLSEAVPLKSGAGIHSLRNANANILRFVKKSDGDLVIAQKIQNEFRAVPFEDETLIYYYAPDQRDGHPQGYPIYYGLPFVSQVLYRLYENINNISWRVGDPSFIITVTGPDPDKVPKVNKKTLEDVASSLATQIKNIMKARRQGQTGDAFLGVPYGTEVKVDILGKDGVNIIDSLRFPIENLIDQCSSRFGLPSWMLGFPKTQGMNANLSDNEADILIERVKWYRKTYSPVIEKIFSLACIYAGFTGARWDIVWPQVNLRDEKAQSEAARNNAFARKTELEIIMTMLLEGLIPDRTSAEEMMRDRGVIKTKLNDDWWYDQLERAKIMKTYRLLKTGQIQSCQ